MVGVDGRVWFWQGTGWRPPVSLAALLVVQPMAVLALAWCTLRTPAAMVGDGGDAGDAPVLARHTVSVAQEHERGQDRMTGVPT
jgi:hypothetical protein